MTECPLTKQELLDYGICRSLIKEDNRKKSSTNDFAPSWIRNTMQQQRNKPAVSVLPAVFFSPSFLESSLAVVLVFEWAGKSYYRSKTSRIS